MRFINSLFRKIPHRYLFIIYYYILLLLLTDLLIKLKQRMTLFEKTVVFEHLINIYNCIFLIHFNLAGAESQERGKGEHIPDTANSTATSF